ncbi:MAG: DUF4145 domain-containing protein [Thermodesulfobacteriota bacterium]
MAWQRREREDWGLMERDFRDLSRRTGEGIGDCVMPSGSTKEFDTTCSKCSGKPKHTVLRMFKSSGDEGFGAYNWWRNYQIIQCKGCKTISFRETFCDSENLETVLDEQGVPIEAPQVDVTLYPPRVESRKELENVVYLPSTVKRIYNETLKAFNSQLSILTGLGIRALIESTCKENEASGYTLKKRIRSMVEKQILNQIDADILDKLRESGNKSGHEFEPLDEKQLITAMDVVEHLLQDVFIMPKRMEREFKSDKEK